MTFAEHEPESGATRASRPSLGFDGRVRIGFMVFGGMLALQSSQALDAAKFAYLGGGLICLAGALVAIWRSRASEAVRAASTWLVASAALCLLLGISFFVARASGTPVTDWVRDTAGYGLFATVPIFALDAQRSASRRLLVVFLVVAGTLGAVSWAIEWLGRREILDLPFDRLVFPSGQLPGMLYLFAMGTALTNGRRGERARWAALAGVIFGIFLLTGTRSSLLMAVAPIAMAAYAGKDRARSSVAQFAIHLIVAAAVVGAFQLTLALPGLLPEVAQQSAAPASTPTAGETATPEPNVIGDRFGSLPEVVTNPASDASIKERVAQYRAAAALFARSPLLGVGPGHPIEWIDVSGFPRDDYTADTPLVFPAKFGVLGLLVLGMMAYAFWFTLRMAVNRNPRSAVTLCLVGYAVSSLVGLPLGFPIEDKGASLALMLLLALALKENASSGDATFGGHAALVEPDAGRTPAAT